MISFKKPIFAMLLALLMLPGSASAGEKSIDTIIDEGLGPIAEGWTKVVFYNAEFGDHAVPIVLILLAGTAIFLTIYFRFANLFLLPKALKTVRGKYTPKDAPGEITHFQALSAALSATVGLGNIAGVAIAIGIGGPGATLWMILLGFCGMTTKFCECTLGVKYRKIDSKGKCHGGPMYYLTRGLGERGLGGLGKVLAILFALMAIGGAIGAGNMFQVNQAHQQVAETFGWFSGNGQAWQFGLLVAVLVGLVILGGIVWIARVTEILVPFMCITYVVSGFVIIALNLDKVGPAMGEIFYGAFAAQPLVGGFVGVLIQGIQRAAFSNEAGIGSAPIAHAAVKTEKPASEGLVALLEPLTDTIIVCTMTALVIVISGTWKVDATVKEGQQVALYENLCTVDANAAPGDKQLAELEQGSELRLLDRYAENKKWRQVKWLNSEEGQLGWINFEPEEVKQTLDLNLGIQKTSLAFANTLPWFPSVLAVSVVLFAFSTMISWSYYGEQGLIFLIGRRIPWVVVSYKLFFCVCVVFGAAASLSSVTKLGDAMLFSMVLPNLIGVYFLLPVVKRELKDYLDYTKRVDAGEEKVD